MHESFQGASALIPFTNGNVLCMTDRLEKSILDLHVLEPNTLESKERK